MTRQAVTRLSVPSGYAAIGHALLEALQCPCGQPARRVIVERQTVTLPNWRDRGKRTAAQDRAADTMHVRTWCGETEGHTGDDPPYGPALDPDDIALDEGDL
jgi:hypothetical protein